MVSIRRAKKSEMEWINESYDAVQFLHSNFEKEVIALAEITNQKAGLGRLVNINEKNKELGGIYVFEAFRGRGIARKIVQFLLAQSSPGQTIYCIPFEHLVPFYQEFGFECCTNFDQVPAEILNKQCWCKEKYPQSTALLFLLKKI
jgi:predicted GNAT family N-acyltransferase